MTTYILKCESYDNSIYYDMLWDNVDSGFALGFSDYRAYYSTTNYKGDADAVRVLDAFENFLNNEDIEDFMIACGIPVNGNRVKYYKALTAYSSRWQEENALNALRLVLGGEWCHNRLHGCCQGDVCDIFYRVDSWASDSLSYIEAVVFNTGCEIGVIENTDKVPEDIDASDVDYWDYTDKYRDDDIKAQMGLPDAVVLEEHKRTVTVYSYS